MRLEWAGGGLLAGSDEGVRVWTPLARHKEGEGQWLRGKNQSWDRQNFLRNDRQTPDTDPLNWWTGLLGQNIACAPLSYLPLLYVYAINLLFHPLLTALPNSPPNLYWASLFPLTYWCPNLLLQPGKQELLVQHLEPLLRCLLLPASPTLRLILTYAPHLLPCICFPCFTGGIQHSQAFKTLAEGIK